MNAGSLAHPNPDFHFALRERRFVLAFGAIVMLLTTLPYLSGYAAQGEAFRFSGFVFGVEDGNSYVAKMLNGWTGDWSFKTPYTAYPQNGLFYYLPYLLLGKLAAPPGLHEQLVAIYHTFRIGAGLLAILASYDFLSRFIIRRRLRAFCLALITLGGGLGWLIVLAGRTGWMGSLPLDFFSPEAFGFLTLFGLPHLAAARALMLWALLAYLDLVASLQKGPYPGEGEATRVTARLGAFWFLAGIFQPLTLAIVGAVIAVHLIGLAVRQLFNHLRHREQAALSWLRLLACLIAAGLLPAASLVYSFLVSQFDSFARAWTSQNLIRSPNFVHYLLAYGLLIPFAWSGGRWLLRQNFTLGWLPVGWVLVFPLLAYAPLDLQRRLTEGVWAAWCVLAFAVLDRQADYQNASKRRDWSFAPLVLAFPSTVILLLGGFMAARRAAPPLFLPAAKTATFLALQAREFHGDVVLASYETGNSFPAWAPVQVLVGHGPESIFQADLLPRINAFYQSTTPDERRQELIEQFGIKYIFWGPEERRLGDWQPGSADFVRLFVRHGEYALYRVTGAEQ